MAGRGESYKSAISYKKWVIPIYWVTLKWHESHVLLLNKMPKPLLPAFTQTKITFWYFLSAFMSKRFHSLKSILTRVSIFVSDLQAGSLVSCHLRGRGRGRVKITRSFYLPSWDLHLLTPSQRFCFLSMKPESLKDSCCSKISSFISAERWLKVLQKKKKNLSSGRVTVYHRHPSCPT